MHVLNVSDVNEALPRGLAYLRDMGRREPSRAGPVVVAPTPVATQYRSPRCRVLFDPVRDANPFFHLFEALWILQGRNDVAFLQEFNKRMAEYSDNGTTFHAAYGARMRAHFQMGPSIDQVGEVARILRSDPKSRQAVISIWDPTSDLGYRSKDIPCNDTLFFRMHEVNPDEYFGHSHVLDLTVANRSNDVVWGAYGANAVQFSVLLEYVAASIGRHVAVGTYWQVSNNYHVYEDNPYWQHWCSLNQTGGGYAPTGVDMYAWAVVPTPLVDYEAGETFADFDRDLFRMFLEYDLHREVAAVCGGSYKTKFFNSVVARMARMWVDRDPQLPESSVPYDWLVAGSQWVRRRLEKNK